MKKWLLGLILLLTLSSLPAFSAAPPKPGSVCSKQGLTKIYKGKKYTCVKSGKKLVWNKGVAIKQAMPVASPTPAPLATSTPTPIPTSSPTPSISPTPSPTKKDPIAGDPPLPSEGCGYGWYYYRINNGVMERSFYSDKGYTPSDPRGNSQFDSIRVKAYEVIRNHESDGSNAPAIEYRVSESFPSDLFSYLKVQLDFLTSFWSSSFKPNSKVLATFTTEKDKSILNSNLTSNYEDAIEVANVYLDPSKYGYVNCGWRNGISGAHTLWSGPNYGTIGFWIVFPSKHDATYWLPKNLPHEITHGIQDLIWITTDYPSGTKNVYNLIEGGAEIFGTALANPNIGWYNDSINSMIVANYLGDPKNQIIPKDLSDVLFMLNKSEQNDNGLGSVWAYTVGFHLWEYLIANYGFDSYWNIVRNVQGAPSYDAAIRQTIGITKNQLYADAAPYILKQFRTALASYINS